MSTISSDGVFTWSTPAPNIDGSVPAPWRVSHKDAMERGLASIGYDNATAYVEYDGQTTLWVGLRDNRDPVKHDAELRKLVRILRDGFKVRLATRNGKAEGIRVYDYHGATP